MIKGVTYLITVALLALASTLVSAYDPSPLQDFCVAINNTNSAGMYILSLLLAVVVIFIKAHLKSLEVVQNNEIIPSIKNNNENVPYGCIIYIIFVLLRLVIVHYYRSFLFFFTMKNFSLCSVCEWKILQGPSSCHS